ncbi:hypothetical protein TWF225_011585 [Orbilia oligospora]|uniref:Uncharacterized protein n=1 Tax=Orbilia oligospora TaxID=2813651 RepID=A0A7C8K089_ORBOL|nr:hypothetical protein TWF751_002244 [Orbilia oligospora]KAF3192780.1 hypothetical protein TWF225_011585 [Orbilia oligospora]KAF3238329.1 hypothetical protein TWF128_000660 [Orbilia oligospora]KAF3262878.1 hypothetical protein TWF217_004160 [Orbilia oligospora]KAF3287158.1 hypothetical protein TWF132_008686 [Orbilia oligospora]
MRALWKDMEDRGSDIYQMGSGCAVRSDQVGSCQRPFNVYYFEYVFSVLSNTLPRRTGVHFNLCSFPARGNNRRIPQAQLWQLVKCLFVKEDSAVALVAQKTPTSDCPRPYTN